MRCMRHAKNKKNWGVAFIERQRRTSASLIPDEVGWRCYYCSNREENVNVGSLTPSLYRTKTICVGSFQRNNGSNEWAVVNIYMPFCCTTSDYVWVCMCEFHHPLEQICSHPFNSTPDQRFGWRCVILLIQGGYEFRNAPFQARVNPL